MHSSAAIRSLTPLQIRLRAVLSALFPARLRAGLRAVLPAAALAASLASACAHAQLWWPGFIDTRGKAFLELPADARWCGAARGGGGNSARKAGTGQRESAIKSGTSADTTANTSAAGSVSVLPVKIETLLPRGARLTFGVIDTAGVASERVFTHVVAIAHGDSKGACAHLAEAGAAVPGYIAEEDRIAFGVHPPRPLVFRAPQDGWKSYGAAAALPNSDARFGAAAEVPAEWRVRVAPLMATPLELFGQRFSAVLAPGRAAAPLVLTGAIAATPEYDTLNLITRDGGSGEARQEAPAGTNVTLYQSGRSGGVEKNRTGSFVAQVLGALDLDGDGVDEIVLRARYYSGGNLKVLRLMAGKLKEVRGSAYEGE